MTEEFIQITGKEDGSTSVVLVGVHGDEVCGVRALELLLPTLEIERGTVFFGYGNPRAIEKRVRYAEQNLNRMFKDDSDLSDEEKMSYEYKRAQYIRKYLDRADALLDIHASFTPDSQPFIICENNATGITECLPLDVAVSGFDAIQPGGTDYYMNSIGKIGICVECGYFNDPQSTMRAQESILAFLASRDHLVYTVTSRVQSTIRMNSMYITQSDQFRLARQFYDFEDLSEGEIVGVDGVNEIRVEKNSIILFARDRNKKGDEAFLLGEKVRGPTK
ncbi:MAG: succinylglutamate desuccinylase/aspartoacylase family protein [Candidatus Uhrbacteria bacterium]|nr:succinylglutamate desuccinylase/aspartoacylase family protein [Candidatus Uhrbacteria bacterium]